MVGTAGAARALDGVDVILPLCGSYPFVTNFGGSRARHLNFN